MTVQELTAMIRDIPDFPKPGILFRDITPILADPRALRAVLDHLETWAASDAPEMIAGIEARGFMFGPPLAARLGAGFVPVRKPGKLPHSIVSESYALEYGENTLEMHEDAVRPGQKVLIVDDLLATGGTASAAASLVRRLGGEVSGFLFMVELAALDGRSQLGGLPVRSLIGL